MPFNFWQAINNDWNNIKMLKDMADLTYVIIWWCKTNIMIYVSNTNVWKEGKMLYKL